MRLTIGFLAAFGLVACGGSTSTTDTPGDTTGSERASEPTSTLHQVTDSVYAVEHGSHWNAFVITSAGVVVIDPTSNPASQRLVEIIRETAPGRPLAAVIYSHWHLDHATGANVLRRELGEDAPIIAHERTDAQLRRYEGAGIDDVPLPTQTVGDELTELTFGEHTIGLRYMGHAHTNTMLVVSIEPDSVVYACDFVSNQAVGWRDLPGVDFEEAVGMLHRLEELEHTHTLFGHSPPGNREAVAGFRGYIEQLWRESATAIQNGLTGDAAAAQVSEALARYRSWGNANLWLDSNASGAVRWVTEHPDTVVPEGATPIPPVE